MATVLVDATSPKVETLQKGTDGSAHWVGGALALGPIYTDASFNYYGEAVPGTALTAAAWRVSRETKADSRIQWADGNGSFDNVFTNLAIVAALTFV